MSHEGTRPAAVCPDLGVEGLIDIDPIVLAVGQGVGAPLPDEAGRWVGVDGTAQEHSLLLVEVASNIAHRLVHRQHWFIQVCKGTAPTESGLGDPKVGGLGSWKPLGKPKPPLGMLPESQMFSQPCKLDQTVTDTGLDLMASLLSLPRDLHGDYLSSPSHHGMEEAAVDWISRNPGSLLICSVTCISPFSLWACFLTGKLDFIGDSHPFAQQNHTEIFFLKLRTGRAC